jgi:hypothetical protein
MNETERRIKEIEEGDAWDDADEVVEVEVKRPLDKVVPVRLPSAKWEKLRREARELGIGPTTMARMWILDRMRGGTEEQANCWRVQNLRTGAAWEGPLCAYWEVESDPISDDYSPDEISAQDLLRKWAARVSEKHPSGLIPIQWFVESREAAKFNSMPFTYDHFEGKYKVETFLDFFGWPENAVTGEPLNWMKLPVLDKGWTTRQASKGGFIQEATGWKPAVLQPFVYLGSLLHATGPQNPHSTPL